MNLTIWEAEEATGIYRKKIYADLRSGLLNGAKLDGRHWSIPARDCLEWARLLWRHGRTYMWPPEHAEQYIRDLEAGRKRV